LDAVSSAGKTMSISFPSEKLDSSFSDFITLGSKDVNEAGVLMSKFELISYSPRKKSFVGISQF
jgi:hypothetical protein